MAKLTKARRKAHAEAEAILTKDKITDDERDFVFRSWHEGATHENGAAGAFFTPFDLACDFALDGAGRRVIDLCAGIGVLSYIIHRRSQWGEGVAELPVRGLPDCGCAALAGENEDAGPLHADSASAAMPTAKPTARSGDLHKIGITWKVGRTESLLPTLTDYYDATSLVALTTYSGTQTSNSNSTSPFR